ncbi:MAG: hypothetical protein ABIK96_09015 [bacterium]
MSTLQTIYNRSPRFLRSLYVNAFGYKRNRDFRTYDRMLKDLAFTETLDRGQQVELVEGRLKRVLVHAFDNVPYYAKYASLKGDLERRGAFAVLQELPVTSKEFINRDPEAFLARNRGKCSISLTSGTTGTPFQIHMTTEAARLTDALWWRRTVWAGYEPGDWIARLVGDPVVPLKEKDPGRPWIVSHTDRKIYLSTFHLNTGTARRIGAMLRRRRPAFLMGYPSSLEILCSYLKDSDFTMDWDLKHVLFSSEPMHAHQEILIREVMKAEIRGLFGSGEKIVSAAQCQAGHYHLSIVDGYLEGQFGILDPVQPAAATTLVNTAMPLIRYQIGDMIEPQPDLRCSCGRTLPIISPVITKNEDWIITPSGRKISPSAVVYAFIHQDISDIQKGQVVQETKNLVRVYLQTDQETFNRYREVLRTSMERVFFGEMAVEVVRTDEIEVSKAGKSRFVLNKVKLHAS